MECPNCLAKGVHSPTVDRGDHEFCAACGRRSEKTTTRRSAYYRFPSSIDELLGR